MTDQAEIHFNITFKNTDASEALKTHATDKLTHCLKKFVHKNTEAHLMLRVEKSRHIAEITFHADGHDFIAKEESGDLYASIDLLVTALTQQLRKHKERMTQHHF